MTAVEKRIQIFEKSMQLCAQEDALRRTVAASCAGQKIIWQEDDEPRWSQRFADPAEIVVSGSRAFAAARAYAQAGKRVCVLNFASAVTPGGGVTYGSQAQEESLCRVSSLYPAISHETAAPFYARHWELIRAGRMKRENRDDCIFTPGVVVLCEDAGEEPLLPPEARYTVDVITCAAPDLRAVDDASRYAPTFGELCELLTRRWRRILAVAAANGADVLILGAFGCGVFANPPQLVAETFRQAAMGMERCFETIEFAVYSGKDLTNRRAFEALSKPAAD